MTPHGLHSTVHSFRGKMPCRRVIVLLCFMQLLVCFNPFFSERPSPTTVSAPTQKTTQDWARPERLQRFLLNPTFPIHILWVAALAVLTIIARTDLTLKFVFICCTIGVGAVTSRGRFVIVGVADSKPLATSLLICNHRYGSIFPSTQRSPTPLQR